ncbi:hypothetical protein Sme01_70100 [Sphaerisporangium melleum]|uniref:DUF2029 domain-containing protein n=1 Tax=Sphaerisporangium melleum TaxID=321316 RepID=A0A917RNF4_9ACTN|nr:hypothetical protein [Sphaerisporangium melleum]GGL15251.1 hypothetical protein GCM10007964_66560 [Sphaerisporangium melleum]GII74534.1 hypothetical protein Sme01_70100 [Sphaerisporangium melleum]
MDYAMLTGFVLVSGVVLAIVAQWKGWRPSLAVALAAGIGVRVLIMILAATSTWQPVDFVNSFKPAGEAILAHKDPVLESQGGWHFLPTIPYVYGLLLWMNIPWEIAGRLVTVVADIALIPLVGKLAGGKDAGLRAFQYACNPLAVLVASIHGQVEPVSLVFGVAAFIVARNARTSRPVRNAVIAGLLMGLALCAKSWPIWLVPGMLLFLPDLRSRACAFFATGVAPIFFLVTLPIGAGTSLSQLPEVIKTIGDVRPIIGEWGWTPLFTGGNWELNADLARYGQWAIYLTLLVVAFAWRRADPIDLTTAMLLAFMVVTPRLGAQYLMWFMPFLVARPTRFAWPVIIGTSTWAAVGYLYLTQYNDVRWWYLHQPWSISSVVLLPILIAAMPWGARRIAGLVPVQQRETPRAPVSASA